jgi:hypothetical protein
MLLYPSQGEMPKAERVLEKQNTATYKVTPAIRFTSPDEKSGYVFAPIGFKMQVLCTGFR